MTRTRKSIRRCRAKSRTFERLEPRELLYAQVSWDGSAIVITDRGDGTADRVTVGTDTTSVPGKSFFDVFDQNLPQNSKKVFDGRFSNIQCQDGDIKSISLTGSGLADSLSLFGVSVLFGPFNMQLDQHVTISGGDGNDTISGSSFSQTIDGGTGDDSIGGGQRNDTINGGDGNDTIIGYVGDDSILGGNGDDSILGDVTTDSGPGDGNDTIYAGEGRDSVYGGGGNDYIDMGTWNNTLQLGEIAHGGDGNDTLTADLGAQSSASFFGEDGDDSIVCGNGTVHTDPVTGEIISTNSAFGGAGNDTIVGGSNYDLLYGQAGNDSIIGGSGDSQGDYIDGGSGDDILDGTNGDDTINGGDGNDLIVGGPNPAGGVGDSISGGTGDDAIAGSPGQDTITGGDGNDTITGGANPGGPKGDNITGDNDCDYITGSPANDTIDGGQGDDVINGGGGADQITGGSGNNIINGVNDNGIPEECHPKVSGLNVTPNPAYRPYDTLTLTATGVSDLDDAVSSVAFYWDANQDGLFEPGYDPEIGSSSTDTGGGTYSITDPASNFPLGVNEFFAQATDAAGFQGNWVSANDTIVVPTVTIGATTSSTAELATQPGVFTVTRDGPTYAPLAVSYTVAGNAISGTDYSSLSGSVTIPIGAASVDIDVDALDDGDGDETGGSSTVIAQLNTSDNYAIGSPSNASVTIGEEPPAPTATISVAPNDIREGDSSTFTVSLNSVATSDVTVDYNYGGSASSGVDYQALPGTVTIPAGQSSATIGLSTLDDGDGDDDGSQPTVTLTLASGTGYLVGSPASATVYIGEDQPGGGGGPAVTVSAQNAEAPEGNSAGFTFSIQSPQSTPITVNYSIGGTAQSGVDFQAPSGQITIPAWQTSASVGFAIVDDGDGDDDYGGQTIVATITNGTGYTIGGTATATITITEDPPGLESLDVDPNTQNPTTATISGKDISWLLPWAAERWIAAGVDPLTVARDLLTANITVTDLPGRIVGQSTPGQIFIDGNAAGYGWFVDPTPWNDQEFGTVVAPTELSAVAGAAAGHVDLLTVLEHEIGHLWGLVDLSGASSEHDIMSEVLGLSTRRIPNAADAAGAQPPATSNATSGSAPALEPRAIDELLRQLVEHDNSSPLMARGALPALRKSLFD